ncbi:hypothetical protein HH303_17970 [Rhodospirillaceae bacterium KN72]|uniref:Histidine phosphotransferase ChpT C-terminal domain-containing protein n=1 Tax=Pacificispira spongiicola TaxID=2729598 RepID=A0A7Y0E359_9PROT|nr:histidine phosphotransferase family protein [Pacificispira spongiicola]NMM46384.1 hypothetical protein [Pacificispira spongiicola]
MTSNTDAARLSLVSDLVASRMAHELVGPIGAISNGFELLEELGADAGEDVMGLVRESTRQAGARLRFYRLAYGRAGRSVSNVFQLKAAAAEFFQGATKHELSWPLPPILPSLPDGAGRLALVLSELGIDVLPRGGLVKVDTDDDSCRVSAEGAGATLSPEIVAALTFCSSAEPQDGDPQFEARHAHALLAGVIAADGGWTLSWAAIEGRIEFTVEFART